METLRRVDVLGWDGETGRVCEKWIEKTALDGLAVPELRTTQSGLLYQRLAENFGYPKRR